MSDREFYENYLEPLMEEAEADSREAMEAERSEQRYPSCHNPNMPGVFCIEGCDCMDEDGHCDYRDRYSLTDDEIKEKEDQDAD